MEEYRFETKAIHSGIKMDDSLSRAVPIYRTSAFLFKSTQHAADLYSMKEDGFVYTRLGNPTQEVLEKRLASLELKSFTLHEGVAYKGSNLREHNSVVVTAKGQEFSRGIVFDPWRNSGDLYWAPVRDDKYPWKER